MRTLWILLIALAILVVLAIIVICLVACKNGSCGPSKYRVYKDLRAIEGSRERILQNLKGIYVEKSPHLPASLRTHLPLKSEGMKDVTLKFGQEVIVSAVDFWPKSLEKIADEAPQDWEVLDLNGSNLLTSIDNYSPVTSGTSEAGVYLFRKQALSKPLGKTRRYSFNGFLTFLDPKNENFVVLGQSLLRRHAKKMGKGKLFVSLTTVPWRMKTLAHKLLPLMRSTPDATFVLNLPSHLKRKAMAYPPLTQELKSLNLRINPCDDLGPITKLLPSIDIVSPEDFLVILDDDVTYSPEYFHSLLEHVQEGMTHVIGGVMAKVGGTRLLEACSVMIFPCSVLTPQVKETMEILAKNSACFSSDDYVIHTVLDLYGIEQKQVKTCGKADHGFSIQDPDALNKQNHDRVYKICSSQIAKSTVSLQKEIPKVVHQIWIDSSSQFENLPFSTKYTTHMKSIDEKFSAWGWKIKRWGGKDCFDLIQQELPQYVNFYRGIKSAISKSDFARFAIVGTQGGLYIDLDFYFRFDLYPSLAGHVNYYVFEPEEHHKIGKQLMTGIFAGKRGDPFTLGFLAYMKTHTKCRSNVDCTGPGAFGRYFKERRYEAHIGNTCEVLGITDQMETANECKGYLGAKATTVWGEGIGRSTEGKLIIVTNPIDGKSLLRWERSLYVERNFPSIDYEIKEKRQIFKMALELPKGKGIVDAGAHIGDLAVPLAQALASAGRSDLTVYAIEPDSTKCDFMEKMALINSMENLIVLHTGLLDKPKTMRTVPNPSQSLENTGAWTYQSDPSGQLFDTLDSLLGGKTIGLIHLDVEGLEDQAIQGAKGILSSQKPILLVEKFISRSSGSHCSSDEVCVARFNGFLKRFNYSVAGTMPNGDFICKATST